MKDLWGRWPQLTTSEGNALRSGHDLERHRQLIPGEKQDGRSKAKLTVDDLTLYLLSAWPVQGPMRDT